VRGWDLTHSSIGRSSQSWDCKTFDGIGLIHSATRASAGRQRSPSLQFLSVPACVSRAVSSNRSPSIPSCRCWLRWSTTGDFYFTFILLSLRPLISSTASCNNYAHCAASTTGDPNDGPTSHPTVTYASTLEDPTVRRCCRMDIYHSVSMSTRIHVFPGLQLVRTSLVFILRK
jgi:hypothetical protein